MITTTIDAGNLANCDNNYGGGLISDIDAGASTYCADILISDNTPDELISSAINSDNLTACAENATCVLIAAIDDGNLTNCTDILTSDDEADELISADAGDSTDCGDNNASYDHVQGFIMLIG